MQGTTTQIKHSTAATAVTERRFVISLGRARIIVSEELLNFY